MWNPDTRSQFVATRQSGKVCPVTIFANTRHARPENRGLNVKQKMEKPWMPTSIS
jgi:hypothetical protein